MQENLRLRPADSARMSKAAFFAFAMRYFAYRFFYLYFSFYFTKEAQTQGSVQWAR